METRWIEGSDLLRHLNRKELLEAVKSGKLTPYDRENGKKIVDYEKLLVSKEGKRKGVTIWRMPTDKELDEIKFPWNDSKPAFVDMENITSFTYSEDQIKAFMEEASPRKNTGANTRKVVAMAEAERLRKAYPNMTGRDAIVIINDELKGHFDPFTEKYLMRIIKHLEFPSRKSGPKTTK